MSAVALLLAACGGSGSQAGVRSDNPPYEYHFGPNTTYYYQRVAVVRSGNKQSAEGDGHYLTVAPKGIFESDENGNTQGKGFLSKAASTDEHPTYSGTSFLGSDVEYVFNSNYSRLNVRMPDGTIYVYRAMAAPADRSQMRQYVVPGGGDYGAGVLPTLGDDRPGAPSPGNGRSSSGKRRYECPICHGSKRIVEERAKTMSNFGVADVVHVTCPECGKSYDKNGTYHRHVLCRYCNGKGYQEVD